MNCEEFMDLCREAWENENYFYLIIGRYEKKSEGNSFICIENKNKFVEFRPETKPF